MNWNGFLFIVPQPNGSHLVGVALPPGGYPEGSVSVYRGTGPHLPTAWPKPFCVENLEQWISEKKTEGFSFAPSSMAEAAAQTSKGTLKITS